MKKIILSLFIAMLGTTAFAQFEAGKSYVNVSTSGLGLSYSKTEKARFDLAATGGYFLAQDWMAYARVNYQHMHHIDNFGLGAGIRYHIEQNGVYVACGALYEHATKSINNLFVTPEVGYTFFINQYLTIEPSLYYNLSLNDFADGSKVGVRLGLGFYF